MKKVLVFLLVVLFIAGAGAWYFVTFRMDAMIEKQIELSGSSSLGAQVSVGEVKTNIKDGSLMISHVTVANPPGFKNKNAFSLNGIEASVDYTNLDIKRVVIESPDIVIEEIGGETNFSRMMAQLEKMSSEPAPEPAAGQPAEPVIVIRNFRMNKSRAAFESESLDRYSNIEVDAVELRDLKGTPTEVSKVIAAEILKEITREAATEMLKAQASKQYEKVEDKVSSKLKDLFGDDDADSEDSGNN